MTKVLKMVSYTILQRELFIINIILTNSHYVILLLHVLADNF